MKKIAMALAAFLVAVGLGCNPATPGGGGTKTTEDNKSKLGEILGGAPKGGYKLKTPDAAMGTTIKQGEQLQKEIKISRGEGFDQDVKISFEGLPEGVSVDPANPTLKHGEDTLKVTLKAAKDAALTKATAHVVGQAGNGGDPGKTDWTIKVEKP